MTATVGKVSRPSLLLRSEKVIAVLLKYGFEDVLAHPPLNKIVPKSKKWGPRRMGKSIHEYSRYERVRMVCEELGTTFIKFAQIASNRPDLLPEALISELAKLQDHVPAVAGDIIKKVLKEEIERPLEELLEKVDYEPIATASIAQVYRGTLNGGKEIVLKIQRPGIKEIIAQDIHILYRLANTLEKYFPQYESFQPVELVKMFETSIQKELDFNLEAANIKRFHRMFSGHPDIYIPQVYGELTTEKVLCMEYIEGCKITDVATLKSWGYSGQEMALKGINLYFEQVFDHGFFHADPHPGNIFVLKTGKICLIDFGMVGNIIDDDKMLFAELLLAIYDLDVRGTKEALLKFSSAPLKVDHQELEYDLMIFFDEYRMKTIDQIDGTEVIKGLNALFYDYKIKIPSNMLLLLKALIIIEGVGLKLDPKYNIIENIAPFVTRLLNKRLGIENMRSRVIGSVDDLINVGLSLPSDIKNIIKKVNRGKLHIEFEHKGLDMFYEKLEIISNRLSFAFVLAALILGSTILVHSQMPPLYHNIPLPGLIGFIISGLLGLKLLVSIIKHGNF